MPYSCTKIGNRVITTPSQARRYLMLGRHDSVDLAGCVSGIGARAGCQPVAVHHFDIQCGSKRVAWSDVAFSIAESRTYPSKRAVTGDGSVRCSLTADSSRADEPGVALSVVCYQPKSSFPYRRMLVPTGYAPVTEAGGRIVAADAPPAAPRRSKLLPTLVTSSPLPDITPVADETTVAIAPRLDFAHAMERAINEPGAAKPANPQARSIRFAAGVALGVLAVMAGLAVLFVWRWPGQARRVKATTARSLLRAIIWGETYGAGVRQKLSGLPAVFKPAGKPIADIKAANAAQAVTALLSDAQGRLGDLRNAGPLNDVLTQELGQLRQRLSALQLTAAESEEAANRASPGFRNLMRDVERVRRIADSAALSIGHGRSPARIPATKAEAFDLLGLNPDVAEGTLKKVADGLRMNWHPDHARDDADRAAREARIKAINIAIDLINGKRAA
ncbi:MAG: hypothetical protein ABL901_16700 [Hyphomicrobiaceae bacterium]